MLYLHTREFHHCHETYYHYNSAPKYIQTMFPNIKDHSNYSLRSSANKKLFVPRTNHKSLSYTGVIIWNALPENIKSSETFTKFNSFYIKKTLEENKYI